MPKRSAIEGLPDDDRKWLDGQLAARNFSGYVQLEELLKERGYAIGKSSIHRYGEKLERKLAAIKASTQAATAIAEAAPDDADLRSGAVMSMVQTQIFDVLVGLQDAADQEDLGEHIKLLSRVAKSVGELSRASVNQKKWQAEVRNRVANEAKSAAVEGARAEGMTAEQAERVGNAVASRIQIYLPDNGR